MMTNCSSETLEEQAISVPIPRWVHQIAKQFADDETSVQQARKTYLNTLAVCSVKNYLQILGYSLDLTGNQCWNPIARHVLDVADLTIQGKGILECRPIGPNETMCKIPPEAIDGRIGYVVVQIAPNGQEATFLGFSPSVEDSELSIDQLSSMDKLPQFLSEITPPLYHLSRWLDNIFEAGVTTVTELLGTEKALAFEGVGVLRSDLDQQINKKRCIPISFSTQQSSLMLMVTIREGSWPKQDSEESATSNTQPQHIDNKLGIAVELKSQNESDFLPSGLCMVLLNEDGGTVGHLLAQMENKELAFKFNADMGDQFSIQLTMADACITKTFLV